MLLLEEKADWKAVQSEFLGTSAEHGTANEIRSAGAMRHRKRRAHVTLESGEGSPGFKATARPGG